MRILGRLALLFILLAFIELLVLIQVGRWIGFLPTVALVLLTGIVGALLARLEGMRTLWAFRSDLARGRVPGRAVLDGLSVLMGGGLLLMPGFLTDVAGFALLLPPTRRVIQRVIRSRLRRMMRDGTIRVVSSSSVFGRGRPAGGDATRDPSRRPMRDPGRDPRRREELHEGDHDLDPDKEILG